MGSLGGAKAAGTLLMNKTAEWAGGAAGTLGVIGLFILSNDNWDEPETSPEQCSDK